MKSIKVAYEISYNKKSAIGYKRAFRWCEKVLAYQVGQTVFVCNKNMKEVVGKNAEILSNYYTTTPTRSSQKDQFSWGEGVNVQVFETIHQARKAAKMFEKDSQ